MNQTQLYRCTFEFGDLLVEIVAENESSFFCYEFMNEGINSENLIPELILDKRKIIEIKKQVSSLKPIFVVHKQHFDNYIVKYRDGMKYLYQIQFFFQMNQRPKKM